MDSEVASVNSVSRAPSLYSSDSLKLISQTKVVPRKYVSMFHIISHISHMGLLLTHRVTERSDGPTKKGHLMVLIDANENTWERRWFVLRR